MASSRIRRLLTANGLSKPSDRVFDHPQSGRNQLLMVDRGVDRARLIAKHGLGGFRGEAWFYGGLASNLGIAPHCLAVLPEEDLVVLEYAEAVPLHQIVVDDPVLVLRWLARLGAPLAQLHCQPIDKGSAPLATLPVPPLDPIDLDLLMVVSAAALDVTVRVQRRRKLRSALRRALEWRGPRGLIHADVKLDNILIPGTDHRLDADPAPVLVDWELCGQGPTGWDIGCVLGSMLHVWSGELALGADTDPAYWVDQGRVPFSEVQSAARSFIAEYVSEARIGGGHVANRADVATYTAANLVARTFAEAAQVRELLPHQLVRLLVAEGVVSTPDELFGSDAW